MVVDLVMVVVILCSIAYCVSVCRRFFFTKQDRASGQGVLYGSDGLGKTRLQLWTRDRDKPSGQKIER